MIGTELIRDKAQSFLIEIWNNRNYSVLPEILGDEVVLHIRGDRLISSRGHLRSVVDGWHQRYTGFRFEIECILVEGEMASVMATLHGSPVNGENNDTRAVRHVFVLRFEAGLIVEAWELNDFP